MATTKIKGVTYEVESENGIDGSDVLLFTKNGEDAFPSLRGIVGYDNDGICDSPREWCNVGRMEVSYRGYDLGDGEPGEFRVECEDCLGYGSVNGDDPCATCDGDGSPTVDPCFYYRKEYGARVVLPLFIYEHSGITIRAGAPLTSITEEGIRSTGRFVGDEAGWDTSFVGFIFDTPQGVKQCIGDDATDEQIRACLESEVKAYASYLEGDISYFAVEVDDMTVDNCYGFIGDRESAESECISSMEDRAEMILAERDESRYWAERDVMTTCKEA